MGWTEDLNACAGIVERGDPARFRTVMAAPLAAREVLFPLYAFNVEVSRAPWITAEPMIAEMRLQWWRDALEEIAGDGPVRRHEVVTPLAGLLGADHVKILDELIAARRWDCYKDPFEDEAHLRRYLGQTSGGLMRVAAMCLGGADGAAEAGFALGVANWFRAIPELVAQKRVPMVDGSAAGVRALAGDALAAWQAARTTPVSAAQRPAFWPASGAGRILKAAQRSPARVLDAALPTERPGTLILNAALGRW